VDVKTTVRWAAMVCPLVLGLVTITPALCQAPKAEDAMSKATAFAAALAMPWGEDTQAALREDVNAARKAEWRVTFGTFASVGVDPRTGRITSAADYSGGLAHAMAKAPPNLDNAAALAHATEILKLAGLADAAQWGSPDVALQEEAPGVWRFAVKFPCQYQGIPYRYGCATVLLAAEDGKLLVLSTALDLPIPASTAVLVKEEAASESALTYASKVSSSPEAGTASAKLMIVTPNSYWVSKGLGATEDSTIARTAWVVTVEQAGRQFMFWMDAADGRLLGGTQSKGLVEMSAPRLPPAVAGGQRDTGSLLRLWGTALIAASVLLAAGALFVARRNARRSAA